MGIKPNDWGWNLSKVYSEHTKLLTTIAALAIALVGLICIGISYYIQVKMPSTFIWTTLQFLIANFGSLLIATVIITILWDYFAKRSLLKEFMAISNLADDVQEAGILRITTDFYRGIEWARLFKEVKNLDILFAYGSTWRHSNIVELQDLARRQDVKVRIMIPDPNEQRLLDELGNRFDTDPENVKQGIENSEKEFKKIFEDQTNGANLSIFHISIVPTFTFYIFDNIAVLTLYTHRRERSKIPVLIAKEGGIIFNFVKDERDAVLDETKHLAKLIFKSVSNNKIRGHNGEQ